MTVSEKIIKIVNKIEQNKAQYDSDRQTAKISALSLWNISKYEFLPGKDVLPEKDLLEKAATIKKFEYLLLGSELKKQTDIAEKQDKGLDNTYEFDGTKKEKPAINRSNIIYKQQIHFFKNVLNHKKKTQKRKRQLCMIMLQNYIMSI